MHLLDKQTLSILDGVSRWLASGITVGNCKIANKTVVVGRQTGVTELKRLQKQFIVLNKMHQLPKERIIDCFVEYLNKNLEFSG